MYILDMRINLSDILDEHLDYSSYVSIRQTYMSTNKYNWNSTNNIQAKWLVSAIKFMYTLVYIILELGQMVSISKYRGTIRSR